MEPKIVSPADCEVRAVIRYFYVNGERPVEIFRRIRETYGDVINQRNVTKWCRRFSEGRTDLHDEKRSGRPTVKNADLIARVHDSLRSDRRITMKQLHQRFPDVGKTVLYEIVSEDLEYSKVCGHWVP